MKIILGRLGQLEARSVLRGVRRLVIFTDALTDGTESLDDTTIAVIDLAAQAGGTTMTPLSALRHE
jgi:hypothetical protein